MSRSPHIERGSCDRPAWDTALATPLMEQASSPSVKIAPIVITTSLLVDPSTVCKYHFASTGSISTNPVESHYLLHTP